MDKKAQQVRVRQVWTDSKPGSDRHLLVVSIEARHPVGWRHSGDPLPDKPTHAICKPVQRGALGVYSPIPGARAVTIRLDRFRPTASGYRLVEDTLHE